MAPTVRRRRFTIFIIICCISLLIISWHSSKHNERTLNNKINTNVYESLIPIYEAQDLNEKKLHISEQKSENAVIKQSQIITQLKESTKVNDLQEYVEYSSEQKSIRFAEEYEYEIEVLHETEYHEILSLLDKLPLPDKKTSFSNKNDETLYRMPMRNHPELNTNRQLKDSISKNRKKPTPYDVNYSIEKLEDCGECKGYLYATTVNGKEMIAPAKNPSLILDTSGCQIPKLDPWDPSVAHLIELLTPLKCPGPPLFMRPSPDGSISLNETVLKEYYNMTADELICNYHPINREHEDATNRREVSFTIGNVTKLEFGVPLNEDYVGAGCKVRNKTTNFEQFFPLIRLKKEIEEERNARTPPKPQLNVILAGIDSVSKLNFLRHFRRTLSYLNEEMSPFEMNGYTKVGDNTFPNLVPLLTGHFVEYYWNESLKNTMYFDDIDLIWKDYAKRGYRTFFAEDHPMAGTFNYLKRGFYDPPTDYYFRPMALIIEASTLKQESKEYCLNSQLETDIIYDYLRDFVKAMEHRPYFAFAMVSILTHDILNQASWADKPTVNLLEDLSNMGAFNNSLLVLFSDHGIRFGRIRYTYIGKYEERMPFMYIHAPKWFLDQYPEFAKNLKTNQDRLMTLFDIHATMVHLLDLNKTHEERSTVTLGTSLFDEIPANRTCVDAHIKRHWCPCETFDVVPLNASEAINASQAIVKDINSQLESYEDICEVLEVDDIMSAMVGKANDIVLRYVRAENEMLNKKIILGEKMEPIADYMITLVTRPGGAVFEGTVRHDPVSGSYTVLGISRLSLYGMTSWCIDSQNLKLFCYCKVQKQP
ncbi:hypothetical protein AVEN_144611-1 [Araneus ventricosus]|uniref:Uncharacterized protein n=1 Tax=Araneus ventricosus TaxID=182803 RepID=A0A4Y2BY86_ARAVE|nr:hypothetical protein AVEN_144611-1 [Araneus ventricosus]